MITIKRDSGHADRLRNYRIVLDDNVIDEIADGQTKTLDVGKGTHTLYLEVDWAKSNKVTFEYNNKNVKFKCANALTGARIFLAIFYATILSHKYIKLERVD